MADIKIKYPTSNADSVAATITLASLATSSGLVAGRQSDEIVNTTNLDLDHLVSGNFKTGGVAGTASTLIEVWAVVPSKRASGTPTWPDGFGTTDAARTATSRGMLQGYGGVVGAVWIDATTANRNYPFGGWSVARAFGGILPPSYCLWVVHNFGQALSSTEADHWLHYTRVQSQSV